MQRLLKRGTSEFLPDFLIWKPVGQSRDGMPLHRVLSVAVKYRSSIETFLDRFVDEAITHVGEQWRELYLVLVADHPESGRSCFQALDLQQTAPDTPLGTIDLHDAQMFRLERRVIREHERLVRQLFSPLGAGRSGKGEARRPLARVSPSNGSSIKQGSLPTLAA